MDSRTYRALLVANSTFPQDAQNLPELEGPRNDAALLRDALCDREYGLFSSNNVRLVQERPMGEVLRELEDFLRSASRQDTLLLYYSGHGVLDQSNEFFLCAHDSRTDRLRSTAIKASDVSQMIDESAAATTLILLDCCHSGRFKGGGDLPGKLAGQGRFVVTSSRGGELAQDAHAQNHASLFTHHLVEGMMGRAPDRDGDGVVCLSDLYDYVHDALRDSGRQIPQKRFEGTGDVPIAMRPGADTESAQPGLLDPAVSAPILDVSETEIDLGLVPADEELPPERILVINRGGGTLQWTVRASADWVEPVPDETGVDLHLRPAPGPNRANVYITDDVTGRMKTVRIRVRLDGPPAASAPATGERSHAPGEPEPVAAPAATRDASAAGATTVRPTGGLTVRVPAPWLANAAVVLAAVASVWYVYSALDLLTGFENDGSYEPIFLRTDVSEGVGVGLAESMIVALGAGIVAVVALIRRRRGLVLLAGLTATFLALTFWRATEAAQLENEAGDYDAWGGFANAVVLCLLVTAVAAAATITTGRALRPLTAPSGSGLVTMGLALVWAVSLAQDIYVDVEYGLIGDHTEERYEGRGWQLTAIVVVLLLVVAAVTCLTALAARGVLLAVAALALAIATAEIWYAIGTWDPDQLTAWRLPIVVIPAVAVAWWVWRGAPASLRRDGTAVTAAPVTSS